MASRLKADRLIALKQKVKAECQRRNYTGSVASYGSTTYDYSITPTSNSRIKDEYFEKNAIPMNAINSNNTSNIEGTNKTILDQEVSRMEGYVTTYARRSYYDSSGTDCATSCTGMCYSCTGTCYNSCSGCGGACSNNCSGSCSGSCDGGCSGCDNTCRGTCSGSCSGSCSSSCTSTCGYSGCKGSCLSSCTGCTGGCGGSCKGGCSNAACSSQCTSCGGCACSSCSGVSK